jgi:hypothetical protein
MKFFLFILLSCLIAGILLRRQSQHVRSLVLACIAAMASIGYYFLNRT